MILECGPPLSDSSDCKSWEVLIQGTMSQKRPQFPPTFGRNAQIFTFFFHSYSQYSMMTAFMESVEQAVGYKMRISLMSPGHMPGNQEISEYNRVHCIQEPSIFMADKAISHSQVALGTPQRQTRQSLHRGQSPLPGLGHCHFPDRVLHLLTSLGLFGHF